MSKITIALEAAVAAVLASTPTADTRATARQRADADRAFAAILKLIAPRIRHFIRQYGLVHHWEDAEQACAIGVHRAIQGYEPEKAQFTTFVNWQLRGELQSLRFRLMTDQRPSAKKVTATTVSLHSTMSGTNGEEASLETMIPDADALDRTEAGASEYLAAAARTVLVDRYVAHLRAVGIEQLKRRARAKPAAAIEPGVPRLRSNTHGVAPHELDELEAAITQQRIVAERRLFDDMPLEELETATGVGKDRLRQMAKRAARTIAELAAADAPIAIGYRKPPSVPTGRAAVAATTMPIDDSALHKRLARVVTIGSADLALERAAGERAAGERADAEPRGPRSFVAPETTSVH